MAGLLPKGLDILAQGGQNDHKSGLVFSQYRPFDVHRPTMENAERVGPL